MLSDGRPGTFIDFSVTVPGLTSEEVRARLRTAGWRGRSDGGYRRGRRLLVRMFGLGLVPLRSWPLAASIWTDGTGVVAVRVKDDLGRMWKSFTPDGSEHEWSAEKALVSGVSAVRSRERELRKLVEDDLGV